MHKFALVLISIITAATASVMATTVECTPGKLQELIADPDDITDLAVTGSINAADLFFIGQQMPNLERVALPQAIIEAYSGEKINGKNKYPANTIPAMSFAGSPIKAFYFPVTEGLEIQEAAFIGSGLELIYLSGTMSAVGTGAFAGCQELAEVYMPWIEYGSHVFADCPKLAKVTLSLQTLPEAAFAGCTALSTVDGSELVRNIQADAFMNCESLRQFAIGEKLAAIGERAFMGSGLQSADMSASTDLHTIGPWAFAGCSDLREVSFPESLSAIGEGAFFDCIRMTAVMLPQKIREAANFVFKGAQSVTGENFDLNKVETIGDYGMAHMKSMYYMTLPETLKSVGEGAFLSSRAEIIYVQKLSEVPETGQNAFEDVDCPNVTLYVSEENAEAFSSAEQWKEFKISLFSGIDDTKSATIETSPQLRGRFVGTDLEVSTDRGDIVRLALYDTAGALLKAIEPKSEIVTIPTADMDTRAYIVSARLSDGRDATLKIARH